MLVLCVRNGGFTAAATDKISGLIAAKASSLKCEHAWSICEQDTPYTALCRSEQYFMFHRIFGNAVFLDYRPISYMRYAELKKLLSFSKLEKEICKFVKKQQRSHMLYNTCRLISNQKS